jgi:dsRNA-specific ribonuclease
MSYHNNQRPGFRTRPNHNTNRQADLIVYNEHNKPLTATGIHQIWSRYSKGALAIDDRILALFQTAVSHRSYVRSIIMGTGAKLNKGDRVVADINTLVRRNGTMELQEESYDRLELIGDSIFHCILTKYLYERFPNNDEGFLSRLRAKVEKGETMALIAKKLHLDNWVVISKEEEFEGRRYDEKILEDVFEAVMGATYLCFGYAKCEEIILNMCHRDIDFPLLLNNDDNYKDQLLRYYDRMKWHSPIYKCTQESDKTFTVCVLDNKGEPIAYGNERTKAKAEQLSAKRTLEQFGMISNTGETYMNTRNLDILLEAPAKAAAKARELEEEQLVFAKKKPMESQQKDRAFIGRDARSNTNMSSKLKGCSKQESTDSEVDTMSENDSSESDESSSNNDSDKSSSPNNDSNSETDSDNVISKVSKRRDTRAQSRKQDLRKGIARNKSKKKVVVSSSEDSSESEEDVKPKPKSKKKVVISSSEDSSESEEDVKPKPKSKKKVVVSSSEDSSESEEDVKPKPKSKKKVVVSSSEDSSESEEDVKPKPKSKKKVVASSSEDSSESGEDVKPKSKSK